MLWPAFVDNVLELRIVLVLRVKGEKKQKIIF